MKPRVLLTDAEERSTLAACRGLAAAGYRVSAAASYRPAVAHWSRSCTARYAVPDPREDGEEFVEALRTILAASEHATVLPGTDAALIAISRHRDRLEGLTALGLPPHEVVMRSVDKVALLDAAAASGLPAPPSVVCTSREDAVRAAQQLGFPLVLKPARSVVRAAGKGRQQTAAVVESARDLDRELPSLGTPVVAQRYEADLQLFSCSGVVGGGRFLALTAATAARTWPPLAGSFTAMETRTPPGDLVRRVRGLLAALGWEGIFQIDLFQLGDGDFAILDLNPRLFASLALDVQAGANLPAVWCDWLLGLDPAPVTASPGVRYRWEEGEALYLLSLLGQGRLGEAARLARPRRRVAWAHFRTADPAPLLARGIYLARRRALRPGPRES